MDLILVGLYLGSCFDGRNKKDLNDKQITHIVRIHDTARAVDADRCEMIIKISDQETENILCRLSEVNAFIHGARCNGGSVLVHCMLGISRSVTVVVAYVMSVTDLGWKEAMQVVRSARRKANPNFGFKRQLQLFEDQHVVKEREKLSTIQPSLPHDDRSFCNKALLSYKRWVQFGDELQDEHEAELIKSLVPLKLP